MSDILGLVRRELDELLASAPQYEFDDDTIERVFQDKVVSGEYLLQTSQWNLVGGTARGGHEDLKQYLLDYLHHRLKAVGGIGQARYFRFVTRDTIKERMASIGLDPSLF